MNAFLGSGKAQHPLFMQAPPDFWQVGAGDQEDGDSEPIVYDTVMMHTGHHSAFGKIQRTIQHHE